MKVKNVNLEWYVLKWDVNSKKVVNYNILQWLKEDVANEVRLKNIYNKNTLHDYLKRQFMYYYWSKAGCEFFIYDLHGNDYEKVDIWRQIEPNLNHIVEYVDKSMDLKFE